MYDFEGINFREWHWKSAFAGINFRERQKIAISRKFIPVKVDTNNLFFQYFLFNFVGRRRMPRPYLSSVPDL